MHGSNAPWEFFFSPKSWSKHQQPRTSDLELPVDIQGQMRTGKTWHEWMVLSVRIDYCCFLWKTIRLVFALCKSHMSQFFPNRTLFVCPLMEITSWFLNSKPTTADVFCFPGWTCGLDHSWACFQRFFSLQCLGSSIPPEETDSPKRGLKFKPGFFWCTKEGNSDLECKTCCKTLMPLFYRGHTTSTPPLVLPRQPSGCWWHCQWNPPKPKRKEKTGWCWWI